jgi:hypothetical protein
MKVTAFRSTDGKLFEDELEYLQYENQIALRQFVVDTMKMNLAQSLTPSQIASFLATHGDKVNVINQIYKRKIIGYNKRHNVTASNEVIV